VRVAGTGNETSTGRRRAVIWIAGVVAALLLLGGVAYAITQATRDRYALPEATLFPTPDPTTPPPSPTPTPSPTVEPGADLRGPLDILLVGVDTRVSVPDWEPHADAVMILHVDKELDSGYLFSLPRDLLVDIPAFARSGYRGGHTKLTHAMSYGSRRGDAKPSAEQGFQLLSQTVTAYTGIKRFHAGAILNFAGFERLVNELGGVDMYVDQQVVSIHRQPNGKSRTLRGGDYVGPQATYRPGNRHFAGWQAIDYARQRYTAGGDYTRQRHQQQLMKAILAKALSSGLATDPIKMDKVFRALGSSVIFDGRGHSAIDFAFALRRLRPATLTLVSLPGGGVGSGSNYRGEQLTSVGRGFITALRTGKADAYLKDHPSLLVRR